MTEFLKQCAEKDTLTAEDRKRLVEVADKLADGRMVELLRKVGDTIYILDYKCGDEWVDDINCGFCDIGVYDTTEKCSKELVVRAIVVENPLELPKDFYYTREQAEQALKEKYKDLEVYERSDV